MGAGRSCALCYGRQDVYFFGSPHDFAPADGGCLTKVTVPSVMEDDMNSLKAVSNFTSCCKVLVETVRPGHALTKKQEMIILSYLLVVESALLVSHSS